MSDIQSYKTAIVRNLFQYMKTNDIRDIDKRKIYQIVKDTYNASDKQREYLIRNYGLQPQKFEREKIVDIARKVNRNESTVRDSINNIIITKLCFIWKDYFFILDRIYKRYQINEYLKLYNKYKDAVESYRNSKKLKLHIDIMCNLSKNGILRIPIKVQRKLKIMQGDKINLLVKEHNLILELIREEKGEYNQLVEVKKDGFIFIPKKIRLELNINPDGQTFIMHPRIYRIILEKYK